MARSIRGRYTKAVDRALQAQADRLCSLVPGPVVLPALRMEMHHTQRKGN